MGSGENPAAQSEAGRYVVRTLGCKANFYDSQLLEAELQKRGWAPAGRKRAETSASVETGSLRTESPVDLCVVNSCTVTDEADRQSRRLAARLNRENPRALVVVTGCSAEVDPERLARSRGIHYVIGNQDKPRLAELILSALAKHRDRAVAEPGAVDFSLEAAGEVLGSVTGYADLRSRHPMDRDWPAAEASFFTPPAILAGPGDMTRAYLKIQEGCNAFCTYCIIPYGRGPSRSLRPREIITQVRELVARGVREVVITGTNIGDYGTDWGDVACADELFEMILGETPLERLRVGSLDPTEITPRMLALMRSEPRFCPHFHVSLQSPHDRVLKLMKRKYGSAQVRECLEAIAALPGGAFVGMDVITGFPGEGEAEFAESYRSLEQLPWTRLHVFPYSERAGTPATRLPGVVPVAERARRARELGQLSLGRLGAFYEGALASGEPIRRVLFERPTAAPGVIRAASAGGKPPLAETGDRWVSGYSDTYLRVMMLASAGEEGNRVTDVWPTRLLRDEAAGDVVLLGRESA